MLHEPAHSAIEGVHHGGVGAAGLVLNVGVAREVFFGGLHRGVGCVVGSEEKPWRLFLLSVEPREGFVGEEVGDVGRGKFGHGLAVFFEVIFFGSGEVVVVAVEHAIEVVEASHVGMKGGALALVPLANESGGVSGGFEVIGEGVLGDGEALQVLAGGVGVAAFVEIALVAKAPWIATGENAGSGRGANGGGDVALGAKDAALGEAVDVGSLDGGGAGATQVAISHVVGENHEDVGFRGEEGAAKEEGDKKELHQWIQREGGRW